MPAALLPAYFQPVEDDRPLEEDLRKTLELIEGRHFTL